uniref:Plectin/eS10 N-terminal domain-containing protein n=1 Tax=Monopterus albus TaxID=43700 RepID=A0A3Q3QXU8_MONAL
MLMSLADLRAIYELLFKDGVIVAKKDKRPQSMHPGVKVVSNLKVICAMGSLRSKGCVRETFAWKHAYYYLTNKGIAYLRDYLHLPPEIMPAPLQGVHCSASSFCNPAHGFHPAVLESPTNEVKLARLFSFHFPAVPLVLSFFLPFNTPPWFSSEHNVVRSD